MELEELRNHVNTNKPDAPARVFAVANMREKIGIVKAFTEDKALVHIEGAKIPSWYPIQMLAPVK